MRENNTKGKTTMDREQKKVPGACMLPEAFGLIAAAIIIILAHTFGGSNENQVQLVQRDKDLGRQPMRQLLRDGGDSKTELARGTARRVDSSVIASEDGPHQLVKSIAAVESNSQPDAVGDGGKAVGLLQIWPITVQDVNRIMGENFYTNADRLDPGKSIEMFMVYSKHYAAHYNDWTDQGIARRWNGGPTGHRKTATKAYWQKVKARL